VEPAIFLDRDNTLIENDGDLGDPDAVRVLVGVASGLQALHDAGYRLVVVTNQAGVARGVFTEAQVDAVNQRIAAVVDEQSERSGLIERFYYCPYHPEASLDEYRRDHPWRKPSPGMLLQAARDLRLDLGRSWMIGDQPRDVEAGRAAGCRTALVNADASVAAALRPTCAVATFAEAVQIILKQSPNVRPPLTHNGSGVAGPSAAAGRADEPAAREATGRADSEIVSLRRTLHDLADEVRSERLRRAEFTAWKMGAVFCQLLTLLVALLGLLQIGQTDIFIKWMLGAALGQLLTITLLLADLRG
jgi:D-glycero-D-manno-heptose 1,7-bisphosphate phosphatase